MKPRILCWTLVCFFASIIAVAEEHSLEMTLTRQSLTPDQAIAAVRSKERNPNVSFRIVREIQSDAQTQAMAQRSLQEGTSHRVRPYSSGIFLKVLESGGFLILEIDTASNTGIAIHLVSGGIEGSPIIDTYPIEGTVSSLVADQLLQSTVAFANDFLATPPLPASTLESKFCNGRFPDFERSGEESFFDISHRLRRIKADESEFIDLAALMGTFELWPIRDALSMPIYSVNPSSALASALRKRQALVDEFMQENDKSPGFIRSSINNREELQQRISLLKRLDEFLERALKAEDISAIQVNRLISTIGVQLGSTGTGKEDTFLVMTPPGLVVEWRRSSSGLWAVSRISLAENSELGKD